MTITLPPFFISSLQSAFDWIGHQGSLAPAIFILFYVLASCFLPLVALMVGGGLLFGVIPGAIYVSIGSTLSAAAVFFIARNYFRDWVFKKIQKNYYLRVMDKTIKNANWKIILLTRLSPLFPFTPLNYAYGHSRIKLREFIFATWLGMLPGIFFNVYLGSVVGSLLGLEYRTHLPGEEILFVAGILASLTATFYMIKLTRASLK